MLAIVETATIVDGMNHWMEHTCLKFEETTNTNQPHLQFINGSGCYSYLGMLDQNGQDVSIGKGCNYVSIFSISWYGLIMFSPGLVTQSYISLDLHAEQVVQFFLP